MRRYFLERYLPRVIIKLSKMFFFAYDNTGIFEINHPFSHYFTMKRPQRLYKKMYSEKASNI